MKNLIALLPLLFCFLSPAHAQIPAGNYFQGYQRAIHGFPFNYHSPIPDVTASLIVRANKDFRPIEWETAPVPENFDEEFAYFIWAYGMDTDVKTYRFSLSVNGEKKLTFSNPQSNDETEWSVDGKGGARLTFYLTLIDKYKDQMGFAVLRLPRAALTPGRPVRISVEGEDAGSDIWYMAFKAPIYEKVVIEQQHVALKENGRLFYLAKVDFTHLGEKNSCEVRIGNNIATTTLLPGHNSLELKLPAVEEPTNFTAEIKIGDKPVQKQTFTLEPVKEWTVYMVQHTHTDIGYTRPQTEILPEHLRYLDYALDYCDQTDNLPDDAKFRWTCEASWAVREYLKSRPPEQADRLLKRIEEGRIEVTGMFFNFSEVVDEASLAVQARTAGEFREMDIPVTAAMQNDVNGIGWCLAEYFHNTGVKYLVMGQHGHRARIPFGKPTAFWWESPSGKRLLAYRSEHYMHGNTLGLVSGDPEAFRDNLSRYLQSLEDKGYPFSHIAFQFSGYITDNSPPSTTACELVKEWNEKYEWPHLRLATASEFMKYIEEHHAGELPVRRVAWPDWWTDGFGSAMLETKAARATQSEMIANTGLAAMAQALGAGLPATLGDEITDIQDDLLFYDEHTMGAAESIRDPLAENSIVQWNEKSAYAWDAVKRSRLFRERAMGFLQPFVARQEVPSIAVFNTLNWERNGLVTAFIDHEILPNNKEFRLVDNQGNEAPAQMLSSRSDGSYWGIWVEGVPALGYKSYRIEVGDKNRAAPSEGAGSRVFENAFYRLEANPEQGGIASLYDKELQRELLATGDTVLMGQFIYEELDNRYQLERFTHSKRDTVYAPLEGKRHYLRQLEITGARKGPIWNSLYLAGSIPGADSRGLSLEIRLYNTEKRLELYYGMHKLAITSPEAVYVAFPFGLEGGRLGFEAQGGIVYPGENQLEGTASDWNTIQNFAFARNEDAQALFGSSDVPLVQFGNINTGRFYYLHRPETTHLYSWVLNNYWTTNFKASQEGELKWSYYLTSSGDNSNASATRFGWGSRIPLLTRVFPAGEKQAGSTAQSWMEVSAPNLLLVAARPAEGGNGVLLQFREMEGKEAVLELEGLLKGNVFTEALEVNLYGERITKLDDALRVGALETRFVWLRK
ncbi:MAG: glycosyl hydrolase family 38 [Lewinellaceae bacterium]|nr:glycosyl hydrolase family 38 [Lewinellaceae bacterium]